MALLNNAFGSEQEEEQGMPAPSTGFDVQNNPQDMQAATDALMYAPMLRKMDDDERKQAWPEIVSRLSKVNPKAQASLDPSLPPDNEMLDQVMNVYPAAEEQPSRKGYLDDSVERQMKGQAPQAPGDYVKSKKPSEPSDEEIMKGAQSSNIGAQVSLDLTGDDEEGTTLTKPTKNYIQKQYVQAIEGYSRMTDIFKKWDPSLFSYQSQLKETYLKHKSKTVGNTPEEDAFLYKRQDVVRDTEEVALLYRKMISGTAVSDQERVELKKININKDMSAAQAAAVRDNVYKRYMRDMIVYQNLLKDNLQDDPKSPEFYQKFQENRKTVDALFDKELERLKKENPNIKDEMKLRMYITQQQLKGQQ